MEAGTSSACANSDERNSECLESVVSKPHGNNHLVNRVWLLRKPMCNIVPQSV